jgi:hypothetical protein
MLIYKKVLCFFIFVGCILLCYLYVYFPNIYPQSQLIIEIIFMVRYIFGKANKKINHGTFMDLHVFSRNLYEKVVCSMPSVCVLVYLCVYLLAPQQMGWILFTSSIEGFILHEYEYFISKISSPPD